MCLLVGQERGYFRGGRCTLSIKVILLFRRSLYATLLVILYSEYSSWQMNRTFEVKILLLSIYYTWPLLGNLSWPYLMCVLGKVAHIPWTKELSGRLLACYFPALQPGMFVCTNSVSVGCLPSSVSCREMIKRSQLTATEKEHTGAWSSSEAPSWYILILEELPGGKAWIAAPVRNRQRCIKAWLYIAIL